MKKYDILQLGHISLDYNIDYTGHSVTEIGGAVIYSSASAAAAGASVGVITKLPDSCLDRLSAFVIPREDIIVLPSAEATSIRNQYHTADKERRTCTCVSQADGFTPQDIADTNASIYHLAGLIYGDFTDELMVAAAAMGDVAVDVQALLRHSGGANSEMYFEDWRTKREMLPYVKYLKTDAAEAEILTGQRDRYTAARMLHEWGADEVVITHNTEVLCYDGKELHTCPIRARSLVGRSGRGDTTFAAYLACRLHTDTEHSLLFATACVSHKMEALGAYRGNYDSVMKYVSDFYPEYAK